MRPGQPPGAALRRTRVLAHDVVVGMGLGDSDTPSFSVGDTATFIEFESIGGADAPGVDRRRLSIGLHRIDILPG